jgi:23S rRNA (uracil1939-C5)-methyltransferase
LAAEPAVGYRVRAKLVAQSGALGLFERGGHDVVDIPECQVMTPRVRGTVAELRSGLPELPMVSSIDVRETDAGMVVTLALPPGTSASERSRVNEVVRARVSSLVTLALTSRGADAPQLLGANLRVVHGPEAVKHTFDTGTPYHYAAPGAFTQTHSGQARWLHRSIEHALVELSANRASTQPLAGLNVLELYAGSGALALRLSARGARVTHVESFQPAVALAERAAREQGLSLRALASDAGDALRLLVSERARFDAVLVNPPRRGLEPEVRRLVGELAPKLVVYVSCDPMTLARDADHFARLGQSLVQVTPFDMIPQSDAVETLALLRPSAPPLPRVLFAGDEFLAVEKAGHEPTLPQTEHRGSLLERVRRLPGAAEASAAMRLELGVSGVCLFARNQAQLQPLLQKLEAAELRFLTLVRGVTRPRGTLRPSTKSRVGAPERDHIRYERRELVGGHSLLEVFATPSQSPKIKNCLASMGHPILGDSKRGDARSNLHFFHRHGLDRTFLHVSELPPAAAQPKLRAELPADLERVLASLRAP